MYASMDAYLDENYQPSSKKINQAKAEGQNYLQQLLSFTKKRAKAEKLKNNPFWALSTAYLLYLNNENTQASSYLSALEKTENPYVKKMSHFLKYEFADHTYNSANEAALINELGLFTDVKSFRDNNLLVKMSETLYDFYTNSEPEKKNTGWLASCSKTKTSPSAHFVKAFLALQIGASSSESYGYQLNKTQDFYTDTCSVAFLKQIMAFANQPSLTGSEKALLKYANLSPHYLALALARRQVAEHQYAAAAETFKSIPAAYLSSQGFDEYLHSTAKDFWDNEIQNGETAADLILQLSVLKQKTQSKNASANTWYAYGKQLYNLSYFGQGWILSKRKRSEYDLMQGNTLSDDFYTTKNARKCFDQALRLQPSAELAAKICYAGALCERNQYLAHYYSSQPKDFEKLEQHSAQMTQTQLPKYRTYFSLLWQKYRNTQYHKEIMNECETYAAFVP
jgi:hypothetical protein